MEWLAQYAEFDLVNEQKLALVFVREVGTIDNATYRQLDSSITHARARLEIHKLCDLGFLEKKGQGRNTYYIRTSKVVSLAERLPPQDERLLPQHGTLGERYQGENERYQAFEERYQGEVGTFEERYQGANREETLLLLPDHIKKRIDEVGKRVPKDVLNKLVVDMCSIVPLSMDDLSVLLHRNSKSFKNKNIKVLLENNQLFYWITEMINHPQQKYVADPSMARSNSKKKIIAKFPLGCQRQSKGNFEMTLLRRLVGLWVHHFTSVSIISSLLLPKISLSEVYGKSYQSFAVPLS
nr:hypothetical protein [Prevotella sp.]